MSQLTPEQQAKALIQRIKLSENSADDLQDEAELAAIIRERDELRGLHQDARNLWNKPPGEPHKSWIEQMQQCIDERDSFREKAEALDWLNTVDGMDWFSHLGYGDATIEAINSARRETK